MRHVFHTLLVLLGSSAAMAAPFSMQFVAVDGRPVDGVVVTLRSTDAARPIAKPAPAVMDQVDRQFAPHVLVIPVGSPVSFPNSDSVAHQVYSFSPARKFKLKLYQGKPYAPEVFGREGIVTLGCNIHDQMRAYVYVVEAQYYGRADHDGRWSVPDVEPGEYTLTIWHPLSRMQAPVLEQKVTVRAENPPLKLRSAMPLKLRSESQVPANWDVY
jgi:plastocyanin